MDSNYIIWKKVPDWYASPCAASLALFCVNLSCSKLGVHCEVSLTPSLMINIMFYHTQLCLLNHNGHIVYTNSYLIPSSSTITCCGVKRRGTKRQSVHNWRPSNNDAHATTRRPLLQSFVWSSPMIEVTKNKDSKGPIYPANDVVVVNNDLLIWWIVIFL